MSKRGAGVGFMAIAAFLYSMNFIGAIIAVSGSASPRDWNGYKIDLGYRWVSRDLEHLSLAALIIGIAYLVGAWRQDRRAALKK